MKEEKLKDGRTSDRDTINPDGTVNHVLEVQNCVIDGSYIIKRFKEKLKTKE